MGGSVKQTLGAVLPVIAAIGIALVPALAPFAGLIVAGAGLVGAVLGKADMGLGEWEEQKQGSNLLEFNERSTQRTIPLIYGTRKVGSNDVFIDTCDIPNKPEGSGLLIVGCLCEGEIEGIEEIEGVPQVFIENELVSEFNKKYEEEYEIPVVTYRVFNGTDDQSPPEYNKFGSVELLEPLRDTAFIVWELYFHPSIFRSVPTRHVIVKGRKCLDLRTSTWGWTQNPALQLYDYITNDRFGMSFPPSTLDTDSFIEGANYCEDLTEKPRAWEVNYGVATQMKSQTIIDTILAHFRGSLSWFDGKLSLDFADLRYENPQVFELLDKDIARDNNGKALVYVSQPSTSVMPDGVLVKYISRGNEWALDDVYIGDTSGQIKQIEFPGFTDRELALDMGTYILERERLNRAFSFSTRPNTMVLDPGDVFLVYASEIFLDFEEDYGSEARVTQSEILPDGLVRVSAVMEAESLYDNIYNPDPDKAYSLNVASPFDVPPSIRNVTFEEELYVQRERTFVRLYVSFDEPVRTLDGKGYPWFSHVDVYTSFDYENWDFRFSAVDDFVMDPVVEGHTIFFTLVSVSRFDVKQPFDQAYRASYKVLGASQLPPQCVSYLTFSISNGVDVFVYGQLPDDSPDIAGFEWRLGTEWNANEWEDATFIATTGEPNLQISGIRSCILPEVPHEADYKMSLFVDTISTNGLYGGCPAKTLPFAIHSPKPGYIIWGSVENTVVSFLEGTHNGTKAIQDPISLELSLTVDRFWNSPEGDNLIGRYYSPLIALERLDSHKHPMLLNLVTKWYVSGAGGSSPSWEDYTTDSTTWADLTTPITRWIDLGGGDATRSPSTVEITAQSADGSPESPYTALYAERVDVETVAGLYDEQGGGVVRFIFTLKDALKSQHMIVGQTFLRRYIRESEV